MIMNTMTGAYIKGDESFNFSFYTNLNAANKMKFVHAVTNTLVSDDNYDYIIRDLIFDFFVISIFTDIDTKEIEDSPTVFEDIEEILSETNIVDIVKSNVEYGLIDELNKAVDLNIEYKTGIHRSALSDSLTELINTIKNKVDGIDLDSAMDMIQSFGSISDEFTPESVVQAYMNSDLFKDNQNEIKKAKEEKLKLIDGDND